MNIYLYSLLAYLLTAGLSLVTIGIIVALTRLIGSEDDPEPTEGQ